MKNLGLEVMESPPRDETLAVPWTVSIAVFPGDRPSPEVERLDRAIDRGRRWREEDAWLEAWKALICWPAQVKMWAHGVIGGEQHVLRSVWPSPPPLGEFVRLRQDAPQVARIDDILAIVQQIPGVVGTVVSNVTPGVINVDIEVDRRKDMVAHWQILVASHLCDKIPLGVVVEIGVK